MKLNEEQEKIVRAPHDRHICVIARAGSGKTTTILNRIIYLCQECGVEPEDIILTTFTVNAARDMRRRLEAMKFEHAAKMRIGTLDAIAQRIVRTFDDEKHDFIEYARLFYNFLCTEDGQEFARGIRYFFFDEFQDCNRLQYDIVREFYRAGTIITVIGDDAQNIYTFRDSSVEYILGFKREFEGALQFTLLSNYRSAQPIVRMANETLANIIKLYIDADLNSLMSVKSTNPPIPPAVRYYRDRDTEANDLSKIIRYTLIDHIGAPAGSIAVLSRNNTSLSRMEFYLKKRGIECVYIDKSDKEYTRLDIEKSRGLVLTTIHGSKGLEWDYVFIIACDDEIFPGDKSPESEIQDRRLFYVGVTRARRALCMSYTGSWKKVKSLIDIIYTIRADKRDFPSRYIQEIPRHMIKFIGCDPFRFQKSKKSHIPIKSTVTDLISELTEEDFSSMRILARTDYRKLYKGFGYRSFIRENNAFTTFGLFVETVIGRQFGHLRHNAAEGILHSVKVDLMGESLCNKIYEKVGFKINMLCYMEDREIIECIAPHLDIQYHILVLNIVDQIRDRARKYDLQYDDVYIETENTPYELRKFISTHLGPSYKNFTNPALNWHEILYDCYIVSLSCEILRERWGVIFINITADMLYDYEPMFNVIFEKYVLMQDETPDIQRRYTYCNPDFFQSEFDNRVSGAIDLLYDEEVCDIKVSISNVDQYTYVIQVMAYALLREYVEGKKTKRVSLFNPLLGEIHEYEWQDVEPNVLRKLIQTRDRKLRRAKGTDSCQNQVAQPLVAPSGPQATPPKLQSSESDAQSKTIQQSS
jgi:hypothetical protein